MDGDHEADGRSRSPRGADDRSRSRERDQESRGRGRVRQDGTQYNPVQAPFRSPRRRQPQPIDVSAPRVYAANPADVPLPEEVDGTPREQAPQEQPARRQPEAPRQGDREDVDMGSDEPRVYHAPAIPLAPSFNGSTKQDRRAFMRSYQKYVAQINALQTSGARPLAGCSWGACSRGVPSTSAGRGTSAGFAAYTLGADTSIGCG